MSPSRCRLSDASTVMKATAYPSRLSMIRSNVRIAAAAIPGVWPVASATTLIPNLAQGLAQEAFQEHVVADHEQAVGDAGHYRQVGHPVGGLSFSPEVAEDQRKQVVREAEDQA